MDECANREYTINGFSLVASLIPVYHEEELKHIIFKCRHIEDIRTTIMERNDAIKIALFLKKEGLHPEQVQDFYPTPGTVSTCMFYTGLDPYTMEKVYVPKTPKEKAQQRALLQYYRPENRKTVLEALKSAHRTDLIGTGKNCLVAPDKTAMRSGQKKPSKKKTIRNIHKSPKKR